MLRQQHRFFQSVLIAADTAIIVASSVAAYFVRFDLLDSWRPPDDSSWSYSTHAIPVLAAAPMMLAAMVWARLYLPRRDQRFYYEAAAVLKAVVVGSGLTLAFITLFNKLLFEGRDYSRLQYLVFALIAATALMSWRYGFRSILRWLRAHGWNLRHVAIIGTGRLGQVVCHTLRRNTWTGIKPGFFISHHPATSQQQCLDLPVCGGLDQLERVLDESDVFGVFIALPGRMAAQLPDLLARLERYSVDVRVVPDMNPKYMPINMAVGELEGMPILAVRQSPLSGWGRVSKRMLDIAGGLASLVIFAIPMAVIALIVRLSSSGPVIFRQERMSLNGQRFKLFKFRTMSDVDAEQQALRDAGKGKDAWTKPDDPRITPIGRFLRRTSLDELPQLFNVLLGEMSLVGPRPERPELIEHFREDWRGYMLRQNVKAGMTGWAQVNGLRGDTSLRKRLQYDLFYIRHWSIMFDLRILWMTIFRGFAHPNAN
ncbi:MAG: undecaprenyl-phosphate glucose phosphotransferase [Phycisphaerales bacterium]|nr:MAG: undecaprenyl-phosphate glucose phosphotransferase [Phycisphaerales bacterium]